MGFVAAAYPLVPFGFAPDIGGFLPEVAGFSAARPALLGVLAVLSAGNGLLSSGATTMVSAAGSEAEQGSAFGVTQAARTLGRTVGPPVTMAIDVLWFRAPVLLGAVPTVGVVDALVAIAGRDRLET